MTTIYKARVKDEKFIFVNKRLFGLISFICYYTTTVIEYKQNSVSLMTPP